MQPFRALHWRTLIIVHKRLYKSTWRVLRNAPEQIYMHISWFLRLSVVWICFAGRVNFADTSAVHYSDVVMRAMAFEITGASIVYTTVCSGTHQRKHQNSASLASVRGIHRWPLNSPHKGAVTQKTISFDDVIMDAMTIENNCPDHRIANLGFTDITVFGTSECLHLLFHHRHYLNSKPILMFFDAKRP